MFLSLKSCVFVKNTFFLLQKADTHLQYFCNNTAKFQTDFLKTVGKADYTNLLSCISLIQKNDVWKGHNVVQNVFFLLKRQVHIFNMPITVVQIFKPIS